MRAALLAAVALSTLSAQVQAQVIVKVGGNVTVTEGSPAVVPYIKSGRGRASFNYVTVGQTAIDGRDFQGVAGSLSPYNSGAITIPTLDNATVDGSRTFLLHLTGKGRTTISDPDAIITILDNDTATPPPPATQTCPDGSIIPADQTCPEPPPPMPTGYIVSPTLEGMPKVADGLNINDYLITVPIPKSAAPDVVGAFRFVCYDAQRLNDDPIVFPGQPGKSHMHRFYGNTGANASSTYVSLRTSGESSCLNLLNRSGYWTPELTDGLFAYRADHEQIYYKRRPASDPKCSLTSGDPAAEGNCVQLPRGLRFIFGFDWVTHKAPTGSVYFMCSSGTWSGTTVAPTDTSHKLNPGGFQKAIDICPVGARVSATLKAPGCWDGKYLDVPNHRDHVAYAQYYNGVYKCPPDHSYVIAGFTHTRIWNVTQELKAAGDRKALHFASDPMEPDALPGDTYHGDWFGAWNDDILDMWHDNCINKMLNCSSGDLGNGKMLKDLAKPKFSGQPQLEPLQ